MKKKLIQTCFNLDYFQKCSWIEFFSECLKKYKYSHEWNSQPTNNRHLLPNFPFINLCQKKTMIDLYERFNPIFQKFSLLNPDQSVCSTHLTLTRPCHLGRPYHFNYFRGCLPQILLGPFLNTLTQTVCTLDLIVILFWVFCL